jgi:hypothetical protein
VIALIWLTPTGEVDDEDKKGTAMHVKRTLLALALIAPASLTTLPPKAHAADGTLYEVSEAIDLNAKGQGRGFKSSEATLTGTIKSGTPLCPVWLTAELGSDSCWLVVRARGGADDTTGVGPVIGTIFVLAERLNAVDAPELKILSATFEGQLDLSPAFFRSVPRGTITGKYKAKGERGSILDGFRAMGTFQGVLRLPFLNGSQASYMMDDGTIVPLGFGEYSVGQPTPRLDVTFTGTESIRQ